MVDIDDSLNANVNESDPEELISQNNENQEEVEDEEFSWEELASLGWSEARIKAFRRRKINPSAYFYRFNGPGEKQKVGEWSQEEHDSFLNLIREGVDYNWGLFSTKVCGRVGYQCSNCNFSYSMG